LRRQKYKKSRILYCLSGLRKKVAVGMKIFFCGLFGYWSKVSEKLHARSAINTIQAKRSVVTDGAQLFSISEICDTVDIIQLILSHLSEMPIVRAFRQHHTAPIGLYGVNCTCRRVSCLRHDALSSYCLCISHPKVPPLLITQRAKFMLF